VPAALKLKEEYGDDLQIIFAESQNSGLEKSIDLALKNEWLVHDVIWSSDYVFSIPGNGLPKFALLDAQGKVVLQGRSSDLKKKMETEIERMVKESGAGPADAPKAVAKIYSDLGKGNYSKAMTAAVKLKAKPGSKDTELVVSSTEAAIKGINGRLDSHLARADWMLQNGYPLRALDLTKSLVKGVKGNDEMTAKVDSSLAKFEEEGVVAQLSAAKDLAKLESKLFEDGKSEKIAAKLADFARENVGTPIGDRAGKLAAIASGKGLMAAY